MHKNNSALIKIKNLISSKKLAIVLIILLAVLSTIGMIIPQLSLNEEGYRAWAQRYPNLVPIIELLNLNRVFQSWWFVSVSLVFLLNLTICTIDQTTKASHIWRKRRKPLKSQAAKDTGIIPSLPDKDLEQLLREQMAVKRYHFLSKKDSGFLFVKGSLGIWGASLFHWGLVLVTVGALLTATMRLSGYMTLGEEEIRYEMHNYYDSIEEGPFFTENNHGGYSIVMDKFRPVLTNKGELDYHEAELVINDNGRMTKRFVDASKPFVYNGTAFYLNEVGYAPLITLEDHTDILNGKPIFQSCVMFDTKRNPGNDNFYLRNFAFPGTNLVMNADFFPDAVVKKDKVTSKSLLPKNPYFKVSISDGNNSINALVKVGDTIKYGNYKLTIGPLRRWAGFIVVKDPGVNIAFLGSALALVGLIDLYLVNYRKVQIVALPEGGKTRIKIAAATTKYKKIFDEEIADIAEELRKRL